jgi:hypothetical protein
MNESPMTNDQLAAQFFDVMSRTSANVHILYDLRKLIANCPAPIAEAFQRDGSLQNIKIPKFWQKYYPVLEEILREGVEATSAVVVKQDIQGLSNQKYWGGSTGNVDMEPEEGDGSRDNAVKILES